MKLETRPTLDQMKEFELALEVVFPSSIYNFINSDQFIGHFNFDPVNLNNLFRKYNYLPSYAIPFLNVEDWLYFWFDKRGLPDDNQVYEICAMELAFPDILRLRKVYIPKWYSFEDWLDQYWFNGI